MREFMDQDGGAWIATVQELQGHDYKGRYHLVLQPKGGGDEVGLTDVRWNTERTARRTLEMMSTFELRRRLRSAVGRAGAPVAG